MATPVAMNVCTDIPEGRLHVRFSVGDGSEVRGYLTEDEAVQIALDPNSERPGQKSDPFKTSPVQVKQRISSLAIIQRVIPPNEAVQADHRHRVLGCNKKTSVTGKEQ